MDTVGMSIPTRNPGPDERQETVRAQGISVAYGARTVLTDVSFSLRAGQATSLIGPNGSGKSTLLNAIAGLHRPSAGAIHVLGGEVGAVRPRVAYVLQATTTGEHLPITAREVVAMGRYADRGALRRFTREDRRLVDEALDRLDLQPLARRHLSELSGGQRQRVFVAQGLVQQAEVLLLDEPLAGLDIASQQQILDVVAEERDRGGTVVTSTHDLSEAAGADHLLLLAGRLVASGPPDQVLTAEHLSAAYGGAVLHLDGGAVMIDDGAHHHPGDHPDHRHHDPRHSH
jgi:manganese transport system ATP-binding protein